MTELRARAAASIRRSRRWSVFFGSDAALLEAEGGDISEMLSHAPITLEEADRDAIEALTMLAGHEERAR